MWLYLWTFLSKMSFAAMVALSKYFVTTLLTMCENYLSKMQDQLDEDDYELDGRKDYLG